ncbi:hypothetical protein FRB94_002473 [Tulasnella sp. JGI-2019a]|nr:hypothetical protein FRB93_003980 [Tulasnella sp. JGI-2019a]KAG9004253.1 hypothetical protein FRB94_002473 [Tulasnella sp. JGI-2019a]
MASDLFADIWGEDDDNSTADALPRAPSRQGSDDDSQDNQPGPSKHSRKEAGIALPPELDALFPADDDEDDEGSGFGFSALKPSTDMEQLAKATEARLAKANQSKRVSQSTATGGKGNNATRSKDPLDMAEQYSDNGASGAKTTATRGKKDKDAGEKKRKPLPKLDEARLLGSHGFRSLVPVAKKFKPKGKGHEANDLDKVLEMYQLWTHRMYPKTQFRDTIEKVEKLCRSRRMMTSLSVWRDEDKNGPAPITTDGATEERAIDVDESEGEAGESYTRQFDASGQPIPLRTDRPKLSAHANATSSSSIPAGPPSSAAASELDDTEMDALMADLEGATQRSAASSEIDDDDWAAADEMDNEPASLGNTTNTLGPLPKSVNIVHEDPMNRDNMLDGDEDFGNLEAFMTEEDNQAAVTAVAEPSQIHPSISDTRSASSTTAGAATDHDDATTATDIDVDIDMAPSVDHEAIEKRRESIQKEFESGWDDMYE